MSTKREKIGCTPVTEDLDIIFYISSIDENGREKYWGHTSDEDDAKQKFEAAKPTNYDMHLYVSLFKEYGKENEELIDDEVIDSFVDDDAK